MERAARVLIVDDCALNRRIFREYMQTLGLETSEAENGSAALDQIHRDPPDLVLLDLNLPGTQGEDVLAAHKSGATGAPDVPIIVVTGVNCAGLAASCIERGAEDYLLKPVEPVVLKARVESCLERKRARDREALVRKEMERALALRTTLMRVASHDLRNPLGVTIGYLEMVLSDLKPGATLSDSAHSRLKSALEAAERVNSLLDMFLSYQRIQAGALFLDPRPLALDDAVREVLHQHAAAAERKRMSLTMLPGSPLWVTADASWLGICIGNYVSNAVKYSPRGSSVRIGWRLDDEFGRLTIRDNGPGVAIDEREKLFEEFGCTSNRATGGEKSTGLGLYVVRRIVDAMGGRTGVDFPDDGGSRFWLELPLAFAEGEPLNHPTGSERTMSAEAPHAKQERMLATD